MRRLTLLGMDHSPWAQTVAIALRLKGLSFDTTIIFSARKFRASGFCFPVLYADDRALAGSDTALRYIDRLDSLGGEVGSLVNVYDEGEWIFRAEELMYLLVAGRCPPSQLFSFLNASSKCTDLCTSNTARLANAFMRALTCWHFALTMMLGTLMGMRMDLSTARDNLRWWARALEASGGPFMCGTVPTGADAVLFGFMQTMSSASGLTDQVCDPTRHLQRALARARHRALCTTD